MVVDIPSVSILVVLGTVVLISYVLLALRHKNTNYISSPLWYGLGRSTVIVLVVLQAFAVIGFLAAIITWVFFEPPKGGVLSYSPVILPVTLAVFLSSSAAWAFLMLSDKPNKAAVVASLVLTALSTIILIAGAAEENNPRWWIVLGTLLLGLVTILSDAVVWNARFIKS